MLKKLIIEILNPLFYLIGLIIKITNLPIYTAGFKIKFPRNMTVLEQGHCILGGYEKNERKLLNKYLCATDSVLEMGACIGVVSLTINKILVEKTKQVSIEPNPEMIGYLKENKKYNHGQFHIENCIVSRANKIDFYIGGKAFLSSSTLGSGKKIMAVGKSLEDLMSQYFEFTAVIMDIEGGELEFFRSFDLKMTKIRLIVWETHCSPTMLSEIELDECYNLLKSYGFYLLEKSSNVEAWIREI